MAGHAIAYFANDTGEKVIYVGVKELMCMGARAPYDHPHVYLDMGGDGDVLCPYCSTHYKFDSALKHTESRPATAILAEDENV